MMQGRLVMHCFGPCPAALRRVTARSGFSRQTGLHLEHHGPCRAVAMVALVSL